MSSVKLFSTLGSPAVRGTLLTIRALGLKDKIKIIPINLVNGDHLQPEFIEKNPLHTVPVLEDGKFILWDSHAINAYVCDKYAPNTSLYPKDLQKRALVDSMNQFDNGYLFAKWAHYIQSVIFQRETVEMGNIQDQIFETLDFLELILQKRKFVAGENVTIADFSIVANITTMEIFYPIPEDRYPRISEWLMQMKKLPYYDINQKGVDVFSKMFKPLLSLKSKM
uniref:Glutathione S-transferase e6 n=1 Tax=Lissorhoptrus oryzophilus TaxID=308863 RepID=A0A2R4FXD9_9CUCU|nr:glutathione S-transferase e6 [Lissorhoptrus oryzophilus]